MTSVDLVDETFVVVERSRLATIIADQGRWRKWWPELMLTIFMDRGLDGIRWSVSGALIGSSEIWLETVGDGVLLHYYLRADPTIRGSNSVAGFIPSSPRGRRHMDRLRSRHALDWKQSVWALKDELEVGRLPGHPR